MAGTGSTFVKLIGGLLLGIGILIATVSGLCTLIVLSSRNGGTGMAGIALVFGGIPFVIGLALILVGRQMLRPASPGDPETRG